MARIEHDEPAAADDRFAHLLASYDERLAAGSTVNDHGEASLASDRLAARLAKAQSFLDLVEAAWPRRGNGGTAAGKPALEFAMGCRTPGAETSAGSMLGRFRLIREAGHGGCGLVFQGVDTVTGREVALKVPRPEALVTPQLKRRFLREARAAAALAHPHIVAVYEAGRCGAIHYIASAWCDGPNLAEWMRRQSGPVSVREAARIVALLADAVQHAHSRGVVHRDLKPANVLMQPVETADASSGESAAGGGFIPMLTDFGLARLSEGGDRQTRSGAILGTPAYMAPEQADGRCSQLGPAVDTYALGVLLFELLTGRVPHSGRGEADTLRKIADDPAPDPRRLRRDLDRDLAAIALRCLEKNPADRYPSAAELRDDLLRYLAGEPVRARPIPATTRLWRWSRRRPLLAGMSAALVVTLAVGICGVVWQWRRAEVNHQHSLEALARAHRIINHLYPIGDHLAWDVRDPNYQDSLKQQFLRLYRELLSVEADDPQVALELAETHTRYAALLDAVGRKPDAIASFQTAIERWRTLRAEQPSSRDAARGLAGALNLAARTLLHLDDHSTAAALLVESRALVQQLLAETPGDLELERHLLSCIVWQGELRYHQADYQGAVELLLEAAELGQRIASSEPTRLASQLRFLNALSDLARALYQTGRRTEAVLVCQQIMDVAAKTERTFEAPGGLGRDIGAGTYSAGKIFEGTGDLAQAWGAYDTSVRHYELQRRLQRHAFRENPDLICAYLGLARVARRLDQPTGGIEPLAKAVALARSLAADDNPPHKPFKLSYALARLAAELWHAGQNDLAVEAMQLEIELREESGEEFAAALAAGSRSQAMAYFAIADELAESGDDENELRYYALAAAAFEPLLDRAGATRDDFIRAAQARYWCGHTYREFGQWTEARTAYERTIETIRRFLARQPADRYAQGLLARALHFRAQACEGAGDVAQAVDDHRQAIELFEPLLAEDPSESGFAECMQKSRQLMARLAAR